MSDDERAIIGRERRRSPAGGVQVHIGSADPFDFEQKTDVRDNPQAYRAIKQLRLDLQQSEIKTASAISEVKTEVKHLDEKLDGVVKSNERVVGKLEGLTTALTRPRTVSEDIRVVRETKVIEEKSEKKKFSRALILTIAGGLCSAAVFGAIVHRLLAGGS